MEAGSHEEMLRAARNQLLLREVNERIRELNERLALTVEASGAWICECADQGCRERVEMSLSDYEQLRAHPSRFAVVRGHVLERVERVVDEHDGYVVVEKIGVGADYVAEIDPREREARTG